VSVGLIFRTALDWAAARHTGPLAEEIIYALRQMDLGESRSEAFARVRQRNDSPALESFISALLQAEELGAPITDTLAQIAREMRRSVAQSARRRAARRAPQISLVVTMVMVPGTLVLLLAALLLSSGLNLGGLGL
jgi:tight adherence protein C